MKTIDLSSHSWELRGWRPFARHLCVNMEMGRELASETKAIPASVPGSAQLALRQAGLLPDWSIGLNSTLCEWVEHRHWEFFTRLLPGEIPAGEPVHLVADGLDYSGWILVDNKFIDTFSGALLPHRFDLTPCLSDGKEHVLTVLFDLPPEEQGQVGFTSKSSRFKPRNNYSWDWCPRFVPIGIWDSLRLEVGSVPAKLIRVRTELRSNLDNGSVEAALEVATDGVEITLALFDHERQIAAKTERLPKGTANMILPVADIAAWWPNGDGAQPLYTARLLQGDQVIAEKQVGFKHVRWLPCEGAPPNALPWICEINGRSIFLRGVNWTPIRLDHHAVDAKAYRHLIVLYREAGFNLLRVWGGAYAERQLFFDLCDEAGLLVWHDFPLSSSGIDNYPPEDPGAIEDLRAIACGMVRRAASHVSLLVWCGGNELQHAEGLKTGIGIPITETHPCIAALRAVVTEEDPGTRFVPTTASGPRFTAAEKDFGQGLHHDVHGPWNIEGWEDWERYWTNDDALFRSETGVPGASPAELIQRYSGGDSWPPDESTPYWRHTATWWLQWERFSKELAGLDEKEGLKKYVALSQDLQARGLARAAEGCLGRFPRCGGILIWMGHDCFPCGANTSIIDYEGNPKPAYFALQKIFRK